MPDPADPNQPASPPPPPASPPPVSDSAPGVEPSTLDLPPNIAAAIACIPLVGGLIFYIMEKRNSFVRFYAMQSIIFGGAWFLFNIVSAIVRVIFSSVPALGPFLSLLWGFLAMLVQVAFLVIWIVATIKAFTGKRWEIPYIGPLAQKQMQGGAV